MLDYKLIKVLNICINFVGNLSASSLITEIAKSDSFTSCICFVLCLTNTYIHVPILLPDPCALASI